jgi:integrase/recombinase XerD
MKTGIDLARPISSFFEHYLVSQRGLSGNTVLSYRDSIKLLLKFVMENRSKRCISLTADDLDASMVKSFLDHIETDRGNSARTRNSRLAAIHSFFRYFSSVEPRALSTCQEVLAVPFKRHACRVLEYLDKEEVLAIFQHIDCREPLGRRDDALLRMLYNTGMRAQELVDLNINSVRFSRPQHVRIYGKGRKERTCPIWQETANALKAYVEKRSLNLADSLPLFANSNGRRLSRFGLRHIISHRVGIAAEHCLSLVGKKITPHTFRHTTAMHLLQSGVELNMIRSWLGHSSIETTHGYVEIDLEMKRKTLQSCEGLIPKPENPIPSWKRNPDILEWLSRL